MSTITPPVPQPTDAENPDGFFDAEFKPLTAEEAAQWRSTHPAMSPWWVVVCQAMVGVLIVAVASWWWGKSTGLSAGYGALSVVFPAALLVRGMQRQRAVAQPGAVMLGFVVWESVKVILTIAMLFAAPKVVPSLSWLALVAGFVLTMKVYWVAAWLYPKRWNRNVSN